MAEAIRCDYLHSNAYRGFIKAMSDEGVALSSGVWWVARGSSIAGSVYYLYRNKKCLGNVRSEDKNSGGVNTALWNLMKYLESFMRYVDWSIIVFPMNLSDTSWYPKSFEFIVMNGVRSTNEWNRFMSKELGIG